MLEHKIHNHTPLRMRWVGYGACAWAMWFALLHIPLLFGDPTLYLQAPFSGNYWLYLIGSGLCTAMFIIAALFPLALIRPVAWLKPNTLQVTTIILAFIGMLGFAIYELCITWEIPIAIGAVGVCVLGILVALIRPRNKPVASWMVWIATWSIGIGMTLYGSTYNIFAFFQPTFEQGLRYVLLGGINFTVEGLLFVFTAWLARHSLDHSSVA